MNNIQQPAECPMEYINVEERDARIHVSGKARGSMKPEETRIFKGQDRYKTYAQFWKFLDQNIPNFNKCVNPLKTQEVTAPAATTTQTSAPAATAATNVTVAAATQTSAPGQVTTQPTATPIPLDIDAELALLRPPVTVEFKRTNLIAAAALFIIVFASITYIPSESISFLTRILVSSIVVAIYVAGDVLVRVLMAIKDKICQLK